MVIKKCLYLCAVEIQLTDRAGSWIKYKAMIKRKQINISRERAITIAMNHNCVSKEIAQNYTDSELKEVLKQLKLKPGF